MENTDAKVLYPIPSKKIWLGEVLHEKTQASFIVSHYGAVPGGLRTTKQRRWDACLVGCACGWINPGGHSANKD